MAKRTPKQPDKLDDERIVTMQELLERIPLDRSTIGLMVKAGKFPAPIQLTRSRIGWRWSAVARWIAERERNRIEPRPYFGRDVGEVTD